MCDPIRNALRKVVGFGWMDLVQKKTIKCKCLWRMPSPGYENTNLENEPRTKVDTCHTSYLATNLSQTKS